MEEKKYAEIYSRVTESNIEELSGRYGVQKSVLSIILNQKRVRDAKKRYHKIKNDSPSLKESWSKGESILSLAKKLNFPSALIALLLLEKLDFSANARKRALKDPSRIRDVRLKAEVEEALREDYLYSPWAHSAQSEWGKLGEDILEKWLTKMGVGFTSEKEAPRAVNTKTPDFLLKDPLVVEDVRIYWAESKASFGDEELHRYYLDKQFAQCLETLGPGLVVYWYGFVDTITKLESRIMVKNFRFFKDLGVEDLFQ
ncbi:MAG: TPD domain-containing protein [Candidatus Hydrothermarchaeales archaeon]